MNGLHADTAPVRRAALAAHALDTEDQAWLLQALEPAHRAMLQPLLDDLRALGIPQEAAPAVRRPVDPVPRPETDALVQWLSREPGWLVESILSLQAWPWAGDVRRRLDLPGPSTRAAAPALEAWLRTQVAAQLATLPAVPVESLLARWVRRVRERGYA